MISYSKLFKAGLCLLFCSAIGRNGLFAQGPVKVFILAGQSNMVGHGEVFPKSDIREVGTLEYEAKHDQTGLYSGLLDENGKFKIRKDVWIAFNRNDEGILKGGLSIGYAGSDHEIGPEFQFGNVLGDHLKEPVLLIKTAWGGKDLAVDFRPPSSGGTTGPYYKKILEQVHDVLDHFSTLFPQLADKGYEIAGFCWNQGWNDAGKEAYYKEYESNMRNFIIDIRKDLGNPSLPFVLINCGHGGFEPSKKDKWLYNVQHYIAEAQELAAATEEFEGTVALVDSRPYWKDSLESPRREIHHYNRNAGTYFKMGDAAGKAMLRLMQDHSVASGQQNGNGLMGYISFRTTEQPPGYGSGVGFYSAVYPMLPQPISHFQIGLASTWIVPDNSDNKTQPLCPPGTYARENWEKGRGPTFKDVFQTIEGGLGIWGSTQFRAGYRSPKFQIVGVPDCYTGNYLISPGWGNRTTATAADKMGVAQLSNHIITPPDGFTFHDNPHGELFGYSWMSLPFSEAKPGPPPTGNRYWTLFFSTKNFKGPVAFIIPDSWSKVSTDYPFDYGRGLDSREGHAGGGAQEINTVPYFEEKDENGVVYSKIPSFLYPVADNGETILIQDIRYYSDKALANSIDSWRKGGKASNGRFNVKPGASVLAKVRALPFSFHQTKDRIPLTGFEKDVQTTVFNDSLAFGLKWSRKGLNNTTSLPQYFKSTGNERVAVDESEVPVSLAHKSFEPAHNGNTYLSPNIGVWTNPGPAAGPFYTFLTDGSKITYYWYKFIDQPSLQQYRGKWNDKMWQDMQKLVEKIHSSWTIDKQYMPAPLNGKPLVSIDPGLIVTPPHGMEKGYVPVVTRQEENMEGN